MDAIKPASLVVSGSGKLVMNGAQMISNALTTPSVPIYATAFGTRQPRKLNAAASVRHDADTHKLRKATEADVGQIRQQLWREKYATVEPVVGSC